MFGSDRVREAFGHTSAIRVFVDKSPTQPSCARHGWESWSGGRALACAVREHPAAEAQFDARPRALDRSRAA